MNNQYKIADLLIKLMSNYTHPMQDTYNKKVANILQSLPNSLIEFDHQIKFFSKDDLSKLTKLYVLSDKLNLREAFIHLQLIYIHTSMEIKYFVVKFRGRSITALDFKAFDAKKGHHLHSIEHCVEHFKKRMVKINGRQGFWFKVLGGVSGTNFMKREVFQRKIIKLFANSCHSSCIGRFIDFIMEDTASTNLTWDYFQRKIKMNQGDNFEISLSPSPEKHKESETSGLRIKTLQIQKQMLGVEISGSQHLRSSTDGKKYDKPIRRRLKTIENRVKVGEMENEMLRMGPLVEQIIHSKGKIRYKLGVFKRSKSSVGGY